MREWSLAIRPGMRTDGDGWHLHFIEITGREPGPSTAFVSGLFGDKPLGCLTLFSVAHQLEHMALRGSVILVPAANLPGLEAGTRISPDLLLMNRRFPGSPEGPITDQLAYHLLESLLQRCDCIVDVHSGMPTTALGYTYDFGDIELSASFGLPVILDRGQEGQLSLAATRAGARSMLVEFGGAAASDARPGVRGCLDVLRYRDQLGDTREGPGTVPIIRDVRVYAPGVGGILCSNLPTDCVGERVRPGVIAWVVNPATGRTVDEFAVEEEDGILLLSNLTPLPIRPGYLSSMVGIPERNYVLADTADVGERP